MKAFIYDSANTDSDEMRVYQIMDEIPDLVKEPANEADKPPKLLIKHAPRAWCFIWNIFTTKVE